MNKILCPVDFSNASLTALEFATRIAEKHGSSIKLVHVVTSEEYDEKLEESKDQTLEVLFEEITSKLKGLSDEINRRNKNEYDVCSYKILSGDLLDQIIETSKNDSMSMVVMGTGGATDINEARMGSNTVRVIKNSKIPVLSVPMDSQYNAFSRIVYGSEFDEDDKIFLRQVINFAVPFNSRLYLVHIADHDEKDLEKYERYRENIKSYFNYKKLEVEEFVTKEKVSIALEHTLNVHDANLLVLVHKSRNLLESLFHKSLTKKMSYLTNFPMLALRN